LIEQAENIENHQECQAPVDRTLSAPSSVIRVPDLPSLPAPVGALELTVDVKVWGKRRAGLEVAAMRLVVVVRR
jgi:hypothetical protein